MVSKRKVLQEDGLLFAAATATEQPHYLGHRERLRTRLLESKKGTLPDYEVLELLLCLSKPRGDVKPLAKELIQSFGSFGKVINADPDVLLSVNGVGESTLAALRIVQESIARVLKEEMEEQTIIQSWKSLLDYCRATMGHHPTEQFRVIFLNKKNRVIADELQETGTIDQTPVYPREIVKRALYLEASSVILVHNHPSGEASPSRADIDMTMQIEAAAETVGIAVHDHVIVTATSHFSFKSNGLM